jgi:hypothetical protein
LQCKKNTPQKEENVVADAIPPVLVYTTCCGCRLVRARITSKWKNGIVAQCWLAEQLQAVAFLSRLDLTPQDYRIRTERLKEKTMTT